MLCYSSFILSYFHNTSSSLHPSFSLIHLLPLTPPRTNLFLLHDSPGFWTSAALYKGVISTHPLVATLVVSTGLLCCVVLRERKEEETEGKKLIVRCNLNVPIFLPCPLSTPLDFLIHLPHPLSFLGLYGSVSPVISTLCLFHCRGDNVESRACIPWAHSIVPLQLECLVLIHDIISNISCLCAPGAQLSLEGHNSQFHSICPPTSIYMAHAHYNL